MENKKHKTILDSVLHTLNNATFSESILKYMNQDKEKKPIKKKKNAKQ